MRTPMPTARGKPHDSRLTVIEALPVYRAGIPFTELEAWYWFPGEPRPRRYRFGVEGAVPADVTLGALVRREARDPAFLVFWSHKESRIAGRWRVAAGFVQLKDTGE